MSSPIAQTFICIEPSTGVEGIFLTGLDLFFQSKSSVFGVEVQIRQTLNGVPTQNILPYASKILQTGLVNTSVDGSVATNFTFDTPVILQTNVQYAIIVIPVGGNPDYKIWTGALGGTDIATGAPIYTNNQLGSLFISSNDLNFTEIQNESMKYNLYIANFTNNSGTAVYRNSNSDFISYKDQIGAFLVGEAIVIANNSLQTAAFTVAGGANTFTVGETVTQSNSTAVYANGVVVYSNTTYLSLANINGTFTTSNTLYGVTSTKIVSAPSAFSQNVSVTSACNIIYVPDANNSHFTDFTVGNLLYIGTSTRSYVQTVTITAVAAAASPGTIGNKLTVTPYVYFTDTNAIIGRVKGDGALQGTYSATTSKISSVGTLVLDSVTSTSALNFANSGNNLIIGTWSGASANCQGVKNPRYNSITSQFSYISPKQTIENWNFQGLSTTGSLDSNYTLITADAPYEAIDQTRVLMSRSNELNTSSAIGGVSGTSSLQIKTNMVTSNNKISPYIDKIRSTVTTTQNQIKPVTSLSGYYLTISNTALTANVGSTIVLASTNATATIYAANQTFIRIANLVSTNSAAAPIFTANGTSYLTYSNGQFIANLASATYYSEDRGNGPSVNSRYISKNVILDTGQDAEDLITYVGAYRPPGTNLLVYAKGASGLDGDTFNSKSWSFMPETSSPALLSSLVNRDDYVELTYDLPQSVQVYSNSGSGNTTNSNFTVPATGSTSNFTPRSYVYITDVSPAANGFNVRQVVSVPNNTTLVLSSNLSFISGNCAIGNIPLMNNQYSMFKYANNNNIARYVTASDSVYDTIKTFAIKIVLVSNNAAVVPRIVDMRTIAVQA